jgi:O-antigen/teichoic acid export membrane protein
MAMIMVVIGFAQAYADMGVSNAIIHKQDTTAQQLSSLYWLNILCGAGVFVLVVVATPLIVSFYGEPRIGDLILWAALVFLITPMGQQSQIMLQKELQFSRLSMIESTATTIGVIVAILCALEGQGVFSLILGRLSQVISKTIMLVSIGWRRWRPRLHFSHRDLEGYLGFGLYQMGERSINYFNSNLDQLLIGSLVGAQALGYYSLAFNLVILPIAKINPILTRVAFPVFAKVQFDNERVKRGYLVMLRVLSLINFPLLMGLAVTAPIVVPIAFGKEWLPAVGLVQILALVALLRSTGNPVGSLLLAKGRADLGFKLNAVKLVTQIPGIYLGAHLGGAFGVAVMLLVLQVMYSAIGDCLMIRILLGPCLRDYLMSMVPAMALSAAMAVLIGFITTVVQQPSFPLLGGQVILGATVYSSLNFLFYRQQLQELTNIFLGR